MKYRLVVLTHGDKATLSDTLDSFAEHVEPAESEATIVFDSADPFEHDRIRLRSLAPLLRSTRGPLGFCGATKVAWEAGCEPGTDYVFHLEHDFVFTRNVDLAELAVVLDRSPRLAQMALMRGPVSDEERAAGGLFESRPGQYEAGGDLGLQGSVAGDGDPCPRCGRALCLLPPTSRPACEHPSRGGCGWRPPRWLQHRSYFTTNVNLMRRDFMVANPWPAYDERCEGRFGIDLVQAGYTFGVWGSGEPWTEHTGRRSGFGY